MAAGFRRRAVLRVLGLDRVDPQPELTRCEAGVLAALWHEAFPVPVAVAEIARDLFMSEAAVKSHLLR
jgi:predicted transcriptional regulator